MLVQLLSLTGNRSDPTLGDVPKDPRNQQAVGILFFAVLPLAFSMLDQPSGLNLLLCGGLLGVFGAALYCISLGLKAAATYDEATVAKRPKYPLKLIGAGLMGLAVGLTTTMRGGDIMQILLVAVIAFGLTVVSFGLDPLRHKGLDTVEQRQSHKVGQKSHAAHERLVEIKKRVAPLGCPDIMPPLIRFEKAVEKMLQAVQDDPERARSLQKYLGVYLDGAAEASKRFCAIYRGTGDTQAHARFIQLLNDLGQSYEAKVQDYLSQGRSRLDVQIDVLSESLAREASDRA
ncbi:MAG: 5-bromo-4-chloroindolyl phosphate hydrolysis family protein [Pseudomonadota bacterium]